MVIEFAAKGLTVSCLFYFFLGMIHLTRGLLNGVGDVKFALINGTCEVICRVGFSCLFAYVLGLGAISVWETSALTWFATMVLCVIRYLVIRRRLLVTT